MNTKNRIWLCPLIVVGLLLILTNSCKKEKDIIEDKITDKDGNVYTSVTIDTQVWMVENLKTTKFSDGAIIPLVTGNAEWESLTTPGYCWYDNDITNKTPYGALYNWYAVNKGNLCPTGWHVPTDDEWTTLTTFLGGNAVAGGKLKEAGTARWNSPNTDATNETGFTALPGGERAHGLDFNSMGQQATFWSSTASGIHANWLKLYYDNDYLGFGYAVKDYGNTVRCLKDN